MPKLSRRNVVAGLAAAPFIGKAKAADGAIKARQFHNQPADSHQHQYLVELWQAVGRETGGKLDVSVFALNDNVAGGDPAVLDMLVAGGLEFFTMNGGLMARLVPAMDIQGLPFSFSTADQVHAANDGALGVYLGKECAAKGIHRFQHGLLENGFRHISTVDKPVKTADDLAGLKIRVPNGKLFQDVFTTLGAEPVVVNFNQLAAAFREKRIDGQENPLVITEVNKLYEFTRYMAVTNHMWAGFNLMANLQFWRRLPAEIQVTVNANVRKYVLTQRAHVQALNQSLEGKLQERGMIFTVADTDSFRRKLAGGFYPRWKAQLGAAAWGLLEDTVGRLG